MVNNEKKYRNSCKKAFKTGKKFYEFVLKPQQFSLPRTIMKYLWKTPSNPEGYQKLIKTCKFFFAENSILVFPSLFRYDGYDNGKPWTYCPKKHCNCFKGFYCYFQREIYLKKITCKVWPLCFMSIRHTIFPKTLMPKLYRSDAKRVILISDINYLKDVLLLASAAIHLSLGYCVLDDNDQEIFVEDFIDKFPMLECFSTAWNYEANSPPYKNFKKLLTSLKKRRVFNKFFLGSLPDNFDIEATLDCLKELKIQFRTIFFYKDATSPETVNRLENIVDEIIETKYFEYCPPFISFSILKKEKSEKYDEMRSKIDDYNSLKVL